MEHEHKEALRKAAFRRNYCCPRCGSTSIIVRDGAQIGGMPGINYKQCQACGQDQPIVKPRRRKMSGKELAAIFKPRGNNRSR